jgi:hypothetical protein
VTSLTVVALLSTILIVIFLAGKQPSLRHLYRTLYTVQLSLHVVMP